jgi:hypothetical protein
MYKRKKDNTAFLFVMMMVMSTLLTIFGIWAIVEFILYLAKDNPFNWTSLWLTIIAFVLEVYFFIKSFLST